MFYNGTTMRIILISEVIGIVVLAVWYVGFCISSAHSRLQKPQRETLAALSRQRERGAHFDHETEDEAPYQEWLKGLDRWHDETEAVIRERLTQAAAAPFLSPPGELTFGVDARSMVHNGLRKKLNALDEITGSFTASSMRSYQNPPPPKPNHLLLWLSDYRWEPMVNFLEHVFLKAIVLVITAAIIAVISLVVFGAR